MNDYTYSSVQDAAGGLLLDAVRVARNSKLEFCVVGGWSPYLRNATPIPHPGKKDVDLLFTKRIIIVLTRNAKYGMISA